MSVPSVNGVIAEISQQAQQLSAARSPGTLWSAKPASATPEFSELLFNSLKNINHSQIQSGEKTRDYMTGSSDIGLNDVMIATQKSALELSLGLQVRNKMVSAYQEIMSMAV